MHSLVEQAPQILPLAGSPRLIILGRDVWIGNGDADLIAVEPTGRLAIIEVKLARIAEARWMPPDLSLSNKNKWTV